MHAVGSVEEKYVEAIACLKKCRLLSSTVTYRFYSTSWIEYTTP